MNEKFYFKNPYEDYTPKSAKVVIDNKKPRRTLEISAGLNGKWKNTLNNFIHLDYNDYTVYTGTSGIALLKFKKDPNKKENLREVKKLLSLAKLQNTRPTFLCGDTGPLAIAYVVSHKLGQKGELDGIKQNILSLKDEVLNTESDLPSGLLLGRAGYLYAILFVNKHVSPHPFDSHLIQQVIESIFICGKNGAKASKFQSPLMFSAFEGNNLGAAHGLSGILYLLLQARNYLTDTDLDTLIKPSIDYLITLRLSSGNFPSAVGKDSDDKVQWCEGVPGVIFLLCAAYKVFSEPKYLKLAIDSGDVVWERGLLRKGYSICHGVSGNVYSFLVLYQTTRDEKHLYRAIKFAEWCFEYIEEREERPPDRKLSLFEGICGPMYMLLDIQTPMDAKFPGFTL